MSFIATEVHFPNQQGIQELPGLSLETCWTNCAFCQACHCWERWCQGIGRSSPRIHAGGKGSVYVLLKCSIKSSVERSYSFDNIAILLTKMDWSRNKAIKHHHFVKCSTFLIQMKNLWSLQQRMHIRRQSIIANALQIQLSLLPIIDYQSTIFQ